MERRERVHLVRQLDPLSFVEDGVNAGLSFAPPPEPHREVDPCGGTDTGESIDLLVAYTATGYRLTDRLDLKLLLGLAQSTSESAAGIEHPRWLHGSLAVEVLLPAGTGGLTPYLQAGAGASEPAAGRNALRVRAGGRNLPRAQQ